MMCSAMLTLRAAPTSPLLVEGACSDIYSPVHESRPEFHSLHMNWLLIADTEGNHRAQMQWVIDQ